MRGFGFNNGYGMMGGGGGLLGFAAMIVIWLVVVAAVVLLIVWLVRTSGHHGAGGHVAGPGAAGPGSPQPPAATHDEAVTIARRRFAAGEISKEQFDEIMKSLG